MNKEIGAEEIKKGKKPSLTEYLPVWCIVALAVAVISFIIGIIYKSDASFAETLNNTTGRVLRAFFSYLTCLLPFSLIETLIIFSPGLLVLLYMLISHASKKGIPGLIRFLSGFLAVLSIAYTTYIFGYATTFYGYGIEKKTGLDKRAVSAAELYHTGLRLLEGVKNELDEIEYPEGTYSVMNYSYGELNKKLINAWGTVCDKYDGFQKMNVGTKQVMLSFLWTYTHISGTYFYFTGEANVNVNYPQYVIVSSAAHEMAHQRGIGREDEANFAAFLVCINSDDPYIRYSGYLDMFTEVRNQLYSADVELYKQLMQQVSPEIAGELNAYSAFFDKYRENKAADVTEKINDTYIQYHGQEAGTKSYGLVVDLLCSYMLYGEGAENR